jgi:hypothetical protein
MSVVLAVGARLAEQRRREQLEREAASGREHDDPVSEAPEAGQ